MRDILMPMWMVVLILVSFVLGNFVFWKQMRAEYEPEDIFVLGALLGLISLSSLIWPYLGLILSVLALWGWCKQKKWSFWEWLDVVGPLSLLMSAIMSLAQGWSNWAAIVISFLGWYLVVVLAQFYRQFGWYKSGRVGFIGIISLSWWGIIQLMVANISVLAVYSLTWIVITTGIVLYLRSGRRISQDLKNLWLPKNIRKK